MSFFGFDANLPDAQKFSKGGQHEEEDVAVYTWGEEGYDGLGDALDERGDDFNDETFGDSGRIGKSWVIGIFSSLNHQITGRDFDFNHGPQEQFVQPQQHHIHADQSVPKRMKRVFGMIRG